MASTNAIVAEIGRIDWNPTTNSELERAIFYHLLVIMVVTNQKIKSQSFIFYAISSSMADGIFLKVGPDYHGKNI